LPRGFVAPVLENGWPHAKAPSPDAIMFERLEMPRTPVRERAGR